MGQAHKQVSGGFTLVEMLVVLAIGAILLAVGVPGFTYMLDRNRVAGEVNEMIADLALTRGEAMARRGRVIMCRSTNPTAADATCDAAAATDWNTGWIVFVDNPAGATAFQRDPADAIEAVIRAYVRTSGQVGIVAAPAFAGITVTSDGTVFLLDGNPISSLSADPEPLRIDFAGRDGANSRSLCLATTGRARTSGTYGNCT